MELKKAKKWTLSIAGILLTFVLMVGAVFIYSAKLKNHLQEEMIRTMEEISAVSVQSLNRMVEEEKYLIKSISALLGYYSGTDFQDLAEQIKQLIKNDDEYKRFGIIDKTGKAYTTDSNQYNLSRRKFFQDAMKGETVLSDTIKDRKDGEKINVYATPFYRDGKLDGVVFGVRDNKTYQESLEVKSFHNQGYSYLVKKDGTAVSASSNQSSFQNMDNIFQAMENTQEDNSKSIHQLKRGMEQERTGCVIYYDQEQLYTYYRPVGINDYYLLTVVPGSVMNDKMEPIMDNTFLLCVMIILLLLFFIAVIISAKNKGQRQLEELLYVDPVTKGPSFEKFKKDASEFLKQAEKGNYAILDFDIDKFKFVNDAFGYEEGNEVIRYIYNIIRRFIREGDLFAHRMADSFVILVKYEDKKTLAVRTEQFCGELNQRNKENDKQYEIAPSIGIYEIKDHGRNLDTMLDRASMARKSIKGQHSQHFAFYDDSFRQKLVTEKNIENRMGDALLNHEFFVVFQPRFLVKNKEIAGAEALVRWRGKDGTVIQPDQFVPIFENNGFITEIDKYVFELVCKKMQEWIIMEKKVVPVSVNLSRRHLYNKSFVEEYIRIREKYSIPPGMVQLEITETALFDHENQLVEVISQLQDSGFIVLMDDFGTGYSSLHMLKTVSVNILKLDKKFVDDIGDKKSESVIESIINLAHSLEMQVTAEGVETREQYLFLKKMACDEIQGYYFSKPVEEAAFALMLEERKAGI